MNVLKLTHEKILRRQIFERDATQDNEFCVLSFKPGWPKVVARF